MKKLLLLLFISLSFIGSANAYEIGKGEAICSNLEFVGVDALFNEVHPLALEGNANAQCMLGLMYYGGYGGVLQSFFDALSWFYIAAQGDLAIAKIHYISTYVYLLENDYINNDEDKLYTEKGKKMFGVDKKAEGGRIGFKKGTDKKWMQKVSASIKKRGTKGKCTPITKPGCTGRAKALAKTFKKIAAKRKKS